MLLKAYMRTILPISIHVRFIYSLVVQEQGAPGSLMDVDAYRMHVSIIISQIIYSHLWMHCRFVDSISCVVRDGHMFVM